MAERVALALIDGKISEIPSTDTIRGTSVGTAVIPEYMTDPVSPADESAWVLCSGNPPGQPIGLLLGLTSAGCRYFFSYKTTMGGPVVRVELT